MLKRILPLLAILCLAAVPAAADGGEDGSVYRMYTTDGEYLTMRAGRMYEDDEYIAGDDRHFRVIRVDDSACTAYAEYIGMSDGGAAVSGPDGLEAVMASLGAAYAEGGRGLICMYSTHSDESYVEGDGESSKWENAGIYDVGAEFKKELEELGYKVIYSEETFHPHDAGAYSRSAGTAEELVKKSPDALFDIHRDGVDADEYETEVEGKDMSKVRLFVGRSNANRDTNMAFAKKIKAVADKEYPGLVKDIYMGKGNYNQELYPQALLLEFGTHEIDKDLVLKSTSYMAEVVDKTLGGGSAKAAELSGEENKGAGKGIAWVVVIAIAAAVIYALASTGKLGGTWDKVKKNFNEMIANRRK